MLKSASLAEIEGSSDVLCYMHDKVGGVVRVEMWWYDSFASGVELALDCSPIHGLTLFPPVIALVYYFNESDNNERTTDIGSCIRVNVASLGWSNPQNWGGSIPGLGSITQYSYRSLFGLLAKSLYWQLEKQGNGLRSLGRDELVRYVILHGSHGNRLAAVDHFDYGSIDLTCQDVIFLLLGDPASYEIDKRFKLLKRLLEGDDVPGLGQDDYIQPEREALNSALDSHRSMVSNDNQVSQMIARQVGAVVFDDNIIRPRFTSWDESFCVKYQNILAEIARRSN